jgi:SAM-dependent methyltransferase
MSEAAVIWHDVECGAYDADLPLWEELAERCDGPVLDLGCGTGRVALHLARRGHRVIGVDREPDLIAELAERAGDLPVEAIAADAREFKLPEEVALALAPMQFLQLLPTRSDGVVCLRQVREALAPNGVLAAAIVARLPESSGPPLPLPDVREVDGWVYSSQPLDVTQENGKLVLRRFRQIVSPDGDLSDEADEIQLRFLTVGRLEDEAEEAGLLPVGRRATPETEMHVGSSVVLLERSD